MKVEANTRAAKVSKKSTLASDSTCHDLLGKDTASDLPCHELVENDTSMVSGVACGDEKYLDTPRAVLVCLSDSSDDDDDVVQCSQLRLFYLYALKFFVPHSISKGRESVL